MLKSLRPDIEKEKEKREQLEKQRKQQIEQLEKKIARWKTAREQLHKTSRTTGNGNGKSTHY